MSARVDVVIVGGGLVGLATAHRLLQRLPSLRLILVEKEPAVGQHQSGHNSGVIHSGLYYQPGSLKARTCVRGAEMLREYCKTRDIAVDVCGKVVVATDASEVPRLAELERRGAGNGLVGLQRIGPDELHDYEPHVRGVEALHVPSTAIVDYRAVSAALARDLVAAGGELRTSTTVVALHREPDAMRVVTTTGEVEARLVVGCAGLGADRLARLDGDDPGVRITPFRGEYFELAPSAKQLVRNLIYPVPDPRFPFLGVHFTRRIDGRVEAGPNAVLALKREGYHKGDFSLRDAWSTVSYRGFWKLAARHVRTGAGEVWRSWSTRAFVRALQKLVPEVRVGDLEPGGAGVRAQALSPNGALVDDFLVVERPRALHVLNAPSPAATASLAIGDEIATRALAQLAA